MSPTESHHQSLRRTAAFLVLALLSVAFPRESAAQSALIDWTHADTSGFTDGSLNSSFEGSAGGVTITYSATLTGGTVFSNELGAVSPEIIVYPGTSYAFNGGGPNDHYLDLFITDNNPGEGVVNSFSFDDLISGISLDIWDIDASGPTDDNYVDEITVTATLVNGAVVDPTSFTIANTGVVTQVDSNTWRAVPYAGAGALTDDGNLTVDFAYANIASVSVYFGNSPLVGASDTRSGTADTHAVGIHDLQMTGLSDPDSQLVFDATGVTGIPATGSALDGTAAANGGSRNFNVGNVFVEDLASESAVDVDIVSLGNQATAYGISATGSGSIVGADGSLTAAGGSDSRDTLRLALGGAQLGSVSSTFVLDNTDADSEALANGPTAASRFGIHDDNDSIGLTATVYGHANSSFSGAADQNALVIDFGTVAAGSGTHQQGFSVHNLIAGSEAAYTIDFESTSVGAGASYLFTNLGAIDGLAAGTSSSYLASFDTAGLSPGSYSTTIVISGLDDPDDLAARNGANGGHDLAAGHNPGDLTLTLQGEVVPEPDAMLLLTLAAIAALLRRPERREGFGAGARQGA